MRNSWGGRSSRKYRNIKVKYDGHSFDSENEMQRYMILVEKQAAGEIEDLVVKPAFPLEVNGVEIFDRPYHPDFAYRRPVSRGATYRCLKEIAGGLCLFVGPIDPRTGAMGFCEGCCIVEDFKGYMDPGDAATRIFKITSRLLKALYGVEVQVVQTQLAVKRQEKRKAKQRSDRYLIKQAMNQGRLTNGPTKLK